MILIGFIVAIVLLSIMGYMHIKNQINDIIKDADFANEFFAKLNEYVGSRGKDTAAYFWLIRYSTKMQIKAGPLRIAQNFRPAYESYMIPNYQIIINDIPEMQRAYGYSEKTAAQYAIGIFEALQRYLGILEGRVEEVEKRSRNPIIWFFEGVKLVLSLPLLLLEWVGMISLLTVQTISNSKFFRLLSGLASLFFFALGLFRAIVTITLGWDEFFTILQGYFN